jgi:hypothetical protein
MSHLTLPSHFRSKFRTPLLSTWFFACFGRGSALRKSFPTVRRRSGTGYEISHAIAGQKERGLPELHVWINHTVASFQPEPPEIHDEKIVQ